MTTPKKTSVSNCRKKELSKMTDLGKLYKKVERIKNRIFHGERVQSTFVPSSQQQQPQNSATQSTSSAGSNDHNNHPQMPHQPVLVNPPYPVHPGFGTGFPQYPYPQQPHFQQQPTYPPSYGWALNSAAAVANDPTPNITPAFGALSLDVGVGNETAGGGFDHLSGHHHHHEEEQHAEPNYLRPDVRAITELRKAQSAKLEKGKQQVINEVTSLNFVINDVKELQKWFEDKFPHTLVKDESTTEELEETVKRLEEKLKKLRAKSPSPGERPIRPPKPRSYSQESSTSPWTCDRCSTENRPYTYRCKQCHLPSHRFDPSEIEFCGCGYCSSATGNSA